MAALNFIRLSALLALIASNVFASPSPTESPSLAPSQTPSKAPTHLPTKSPYLVEEEYQVKICPTQTLGTAEGAIMLEGELADGSDFTGVPSKPIMAGRGNSTLLIYQSTAVQKIIAQFATTYGNDGDWTAASPPNMTLNSTMFGFTDAENASLATAIYGPKESAVLYTVPVVGGPAALKLRWLTTSTLKFGSVIDTGLTATDISGTVRLANGYSVIAFNRNSPLTAANIKIVRSEVISTNGEKTYMFVPVQQSTAAGKIPVAPINTVFQSAVDAKGFVVMVYPQSTSQLAVTVYNSSSIYNTIEAKAVIPLLGSASADMAARIAITSPAANTFLVVYVDKAVNNKLVMVYTRNAFTSFSTPSVIGTVVVPKATPSISLLWTSNQTITVFEFDTPKAYGLSWLWKSESKVSSGNGTSLFNNASHGAWASSSVLMWESDYNWTTAAVSSQTSYGFNFVADTAQAVSDIQTASCLVFSKPAAKSAASASAGVSMLLSAFVLMNALMTLF